MTTDNPDPLEVWDEAYKAWQAAWPHRDPEAADQAAAAIIAQHYATVIAENERLREALRRIAPLLDYLPHPHCVEAVDIARQALGAKP